MQGLKIDVPQLATWPIEYLLEQDAQFEQDFTASTVDETYRAVFIAGTWAYLIHGYLGSLQAVFGLAIQQQIRSVLLQVLERLAGAAEATEYTLQLITGAKEIGRLRVEYYEQEIEIPLEMNVALALLLGLPESPDFAPSAFQRTEQIKKMAPDVEQFFSDYLAHQGQRILLASAPTLALYNLNQARQ